MPHRFPVITISRLFGSGGHSIAYALEHPTVSRPFVSEHARELDDEVIDRHIALFVNRYSLALGEVGRRAVRELTGLPDLRLGWEPLHGS